jgi:hypothetical protein
MIFNDERLKTITPKMMSSLVFCCCIKLLEVGYFIKKRCFIKALYAHLLRRLKVEDCLASGEGLMAGGITMVRAHAEEDFGNQVFSFITTHSHGT